MARGCQNAERTKHPEVFNWDEKVTFNRDLINKCDSRTTSSSREMRNGSSSESSRVFVKNKMRGTMSIPEKEKGRKEDLERERDFPEGV